MELASNYANKASAIDECTKSLAQSEEEARNTCTSVAQTLLHTRTLAVVIFGLLIIYFDVVLASFSLELVHNSTKYAFPWFNPVVESRPEQYQMHHINETQALPEYSPPLPPYAEKREPMETDSPASNANGRSNQDRTIITIQENVDQNNRLRI